MAESFKNTVKALETYHDAHRDALSNKAANRWYTSSYPDYASMLAELDAADVNESYQEHYPKIGASEPGGSAAKEQGLRLQATFVANVRRGVRAKLVSSIDSKRGSVDQRRYAYIDTIVTKVMLGRMSSWVNNKSGDDNGSS